MMIYNIDLRNRGTIPKVEFCIFMLEKPDEILYEFKPSEDKTDTDFTYYGELLNQTMVFLGKGFERRVVLSEKFIHAVCDDSIKKGKIHLSIDIFKGVPPILPGLSDAELMASLDFEIIRRALKEHKVTNDSYLMMIVNAIGMFGVRDDIELLVPYFPGPRCGSRFRIDILMRLCIKYAYKTEIIAETVDDYFKDKMYVEEYDTNPLCISFRRIPISKETR